VSKSNEALSFWERKILKWEQWRYSKWLVFYPFSWTIRRRLITSSNIILAKPTSDWTILELGCGSGYLARRIGKKCKAYLGIDIAPNAVELAKNKNKISHVTFETGDVSTIEFGEYDLVVFLGLTDWLTLDELKNLLKKLKTKNICFSFTESKAVSRYSPYRFYRHFIDKKFQGDKQSSYKARTYTIQEIDKLLNAANYKGEYLKTASFFDPGALVWAKR